jgi:hypothetical protein
MCVAHLLCVLPALARCGGCRVLELLQHTIESTRAGDAQRSNECAGKRPCSMLKSCRTAWQAQHSLLVWCAGGMHPHTDQGKHAPCTRHHTAPQTHLLCSPLDVVAKGLVDGAPDGLQQGALGLLLRFLQQHLSLCWQENKADVGNSHMQTSVTIIACKRSGCYVKAG